jgi:hypothetical protein
MRILDRRGAVLVARDEEQSSRFCVSSTGTPLKSKRVPTSRRTWSSALRKLLGIEVAHDVERLVSCHPSSCSLRPSGAPASVPAVPRAPTRGSGRSGRPTRPPRSGSRPTGRRVHRPDPSTMRATPRGPSSPRPNGAPR